MKTTLKCSLSLASVALLSALGVTVVTETAHAAPVKKPKVAQEAPKSAGIAQSMGKLRWGMSREQVLEHFTSGIKDKYKPLIAKATSALEEDKLRANMRDELARIRTSIIEFDGDKTGADVSFLRGEFTHKNGESMLKVSENNSDNYYFFIQDKLWKWYKAFDADVFEGKSFDQFADAIQGRYGKAQHRTEKTSAGRHDSLEWQDQATRLRAVDNKTFYGFYCLVFEDKDTLRQLAHLRTVKSDDAQAQNRFVESATSDPGRADDNNPDIVDRITGKVRRRAEPAKASQTTTVSDAPAKPVTLEPSSGGVSEEDDPLKGLGL